MRKFINKPNIDMYPGIKVTKDTELEYENENVRQKLKNLKFESLTTIKGDNFVSKYDTTIELKEGDILIYENEGRGYIVPVEEFVTVDEAIEDLKPLKEV